MIETHLKKLVSVPSSVQEKKIHPQHREKSQRCGTGRTALASTPTSRTHLLNRTPAVGTPLLSGPLDCPLLARKGHLRRMAVAFSKRECSARSSSEGRFPPSAGLLSTHLPSCSSATWRQATSAPSIADAAAPAPAPARLLPQGRRRRVLRRLASALVTAMARAAPPPQRGPTWGLAGPKTPGTRNGSRSPLRPGRPCGEGPGRR